MPLFRDLTEAGDSSRRHCDAHRGSETAIARQSGRRVAEEKSEAPLGVLSRLVMASSPQDSVARHQAAANEVRAAVEMAVALIGWPQGATTAAGAAEGSIGGAVVPHTGSSGPPAADVTAVVRPFSGGVAYTHAGVHRLLVLPRQRPLRQRPLRQQGALWA